MILENMVMFQIAVVIKFLFTFTFYKSFCFHPHENESLAQKLIKINSIFHYFEAFSTTLPNFRFLSVIT